MFSAGITITGKMTPEFSEILTPEALDFLATLERAFGARRRELLALREARQAEIDKGQLPNFLPETAVIREGDWQVAATPPALQKRWVEITGPTDRKMVINALNSGANIFMTDFEDANSPTWHNMVDGQINLRDAVRGTISLERKGKQYSLNPETAVMIIRPRGWHLKEKHILIDGQPLSGSLMDFGLYLFHNGHLLHKNGRGPFFYLPKLESHLEARLWNDVFIKAQDELNIPQGTIRATVLIETILAAFEMEEILYELRDHSAGLNAGRWDYIFSAIKKFRNVPGVLFPDRAQIGMTVPFMRAYSELLIRTCHKRGAHAIGGMAAFIPRRDPEANQVAFAKVTADKERESQDGYDGSWVAHPGLVPLVQEIFAAIMGDNLHQKQKLRDDVQINGSQLIDFNVTDGKITEDGVRLNINVAILYIESWLRGTGAAALYNLMEDAATAEISRAQIWQWINNDAAKLDDGRSVDLPLVQSLIPQEVQKIRALVGDDQFESGQFEQAQAIFEKLVSADFIDFLTLLAYDYVD